MPTSQLIASQAECRRIVRSNYENFLVGSILLPHRLRQPFFDIYAFCRTADDLADESPSPEVATSELNQYRERIKMLFEQGHAEGIFVALADTVRKFDLPREPFDDLLRAFLQDQTKTHYATDSELMEYCRGSANPVGRLVLRLGQIDDPGCDELSDEICTGLQLANFWQDVKRDFLKGRRYVPEEWLLKNEIDDGLMRQTIESNQATPQRFRDVIEACCDRTRERFETGRQLISLVPSWLARDLELFIGGGVATLDAIHRINYDVLRQRVVVSKWQQGRLLARTVWRSWR